MSCWLQEESVSSGEDEGESEVEEQASPGDVEKTQPSLDFNHILNSLQPQYVSILGACDSRLLLCFVSVPIKLMKFQFIF